MGVGFGIFFPEIEVPLVIGGVFLGSNLGKAIGLVGGKVIGDLVNELIEHEIIDPASDQVMNEILGKWFMDQSTSKNVTCRSDICGKGSQEKSCECQPCSGNLEYQDFSGQSSCKQCTLGSWGSECYSSFGHCGCRACGIGSYGTSNGCQ